MCRLYDAAAGVQWFIRPHGLRVYVLRLVQSGMYHVL